MSGFDIGGLAHCSVTSVITFVQHIKRTVDCHFEVKHLLDDVEEVSRRIEAKISIMKGIVEARSTSCHFFDSILLNIKEVNDKFSKIREEMEARYKVSNLIRSPELSRRLNSILSDLKAEDSTLTIVGVVATVLTESPRGGPSAVIENFQYLRQDTRDLEYLSADIERSEEKDTEFGTTDLPLEVLCSESLGRRYYGEALTFYEGRLEKDYVSAARLFKAAFDKGTWQAAFYLGKLNYKGQGVVQDFEKAFNYYLVGASEGDGESYAQVGVCLCLGRGIERNYEKAVGYYKKAAHAGCKTGKVYYGFCVFYGRTMAPNPSLGFKLLKEGSQAGSYEANDTLAECYKNGIEVKMRCTSSAFELMKIAYENGAAWSGTNLARYYEEGIGTERDYAIAARMYKKLYDGGGIEGAYAQPYYARCLILGRGLRKNVRKGLRLLNEGCAASSKSSSWDILGDCYRYGHGINRNKTKAIDSYKRSIALNRGAESAVLSHYSLAEMHASGEGLPQSYENSLYYYMYAADRYHNKAQWKLAIMFEHGLGIDLNTDRAVMYFKLCTKGGNEEAHLKVEWYLVKGQGVERTRISTENR